MQNSPPFNFFPPPSTAPQQFGFGQNQAPAGFPTPNVNQFTFPNNENAMMQQQSIPASVFPFQTQLLPPTVFPSQSTSTCRKLPSIVSTNIRHYIPQTEQLPIPQGLIAGVGRYSQEAIDYLVGKPKNSLPWPQTNFPPKAEPGFGLNDFLQPSAGEIKVIYKDQNFGRNLNFHEFEFPQDSYTFGVSESRSNRLRPFHYNKTAVANHLKTALAKVKPQSQHFKDLKATLDLDARPNEIDSRSISTAKPNLSREPFTKTFKFSNTNFLSDLRPNSTSGNYLPRKRFYSKLPNNDSYYFRRRDLERMPTDYLHEFDLIEVYDMPELPKLDVKPFHGFNHVITERTSRNSFPAQKNFLQGNTTPINIETLQPATWKKLSTQSSRLEETLKQEVMEAGKNKRTFFYDAGRILRKIETNSRYSQKPVREEAWNFFDSPMTSRNSGPPTRNDQVDYSKLIQSHGLIPTNFSQNQTNYLQQLKPKPMVANFSQKFSSLDFQRLHQRPRQDFDMIINGPGRLNAMRSRVGQIDMIEIIQDNSCREQQNFEPEVDSLVSPNFQDARMYPYDANRKDPNRSRQQRARSRMTHSRRFKCGVSLTNPNYYCNPPVEKLHRMTDSEGNCFVKDFEVGHVQYGNVVFPGEINVAGLNLDTTVEFLPEEIIVYPNQDVAPKVGTGLNRPAIVTLEEIWPKDSVSRAALQRGKRLTSFETVLRNACRNFKGEFVSYEGQLGRWTFKVPHFVE